MHPPKTIKLKKAFEKYADKTQFSQSKCITKFHRHMETGEITALIDVEGQFFKIPADYWKARKRELQHLIDNVLQAEMPLRAISSYIAADVRLFSWSLIDKRVPPPKADSIEYISGAIIALRDTTSEDKYVLQSLLELTENIIRSSNKNGIVLVDLSSLNKTIKRSRKSKGGRPALPAPDGMFEAIITRIVSGGKTPGEGALKKIMKRYFEKIGDAEPHVYKIKDIAELTYGENYFNNRAQIIAKILRTHEGAHNRSNSTPLRTGVIPSEEKGEGQEPNDIVAVSDEPSPPGESTG